MLINIFVTLFPLHYYMMCFCYTSTIEYFRRHSSPREKRGRRAARCEWESLESELPPEVRCWWQCPSHIAATTIPSSLWVGKSCHQTCNTDLPVSLSFSTTILFPNTQSTKSFKKAPNHQLSSSGQWQKLGKQLWLQLRRASTRWEGEDGGKYISDNKHKRII